MDERGWRYPPVWGWPQAAAAQLHGSVDGVGGWRHPRGIRDVLYSLASRLWLVFSTTRVGQKEPPIVFR